MQNKYSTSTENNSVPEFQELSARIKKIESKGESVCLWMDEYSRFSKKWSPRSYEGFAPAIGLWVLSTIAARRVTFEFGKPKSTSLYIALVGESTLPAKTTGAEIGLDVLSDAGFDNRLLPDTCTPQKLMNLMSIKVPFGYEKLSVEQKDRLLKTWAFQCQKGWFFDEFGGLLSCMMQKDGPYREFKNLLCRLNNLPKKLSNSLITRGDDVMQIPYLSLLALMPPSGMAPYAKENSELWNGGFFPRFSFVTAPVGLNKKDRFPREHYEIPGLVLEPLIAWDKRLGTPKVNVIDGEAILTPTENAPLVFSEKTYDAYYDYDNELRDMIAQFPNHRLDGNYGRFAEKASRISALFASLEGSSTIEISHWGKAQAIVEQWRRDLHELCRQIAETNSPQQVDDELKILRAIEIKQNPTSRQIQQFTGLKWYEVEPILLSLLEAEKIISHGEGRAIRYALPTYNFYQF